MAAVRSILVTGGAGFIGSHLVERLLRRGDRVTVVDDLSTGRGSNLDDARRLGGDRLEFLGRKVSAAEPALRDRKFDQVFHLAAAVGVRRVMEQPAESIETNVVETGAALRVARASRSAFLMASSSEVYGKSARLPFHEDDDVTYGPTTVTRWSYGCSKALDEHMTLAEARDGGVRAVVVRIFNTVGPRQSGRWGMVLPRFVEAAVARRPVEVHGDGRQSRCFADVRDVSAGLEALLDHDAASGRVFNIGSDEPVTIRGLAEQVIAAAASPAGLVLVPHASVYPEGFEDLPARQPDLGRIRAAIGFRASMPLARTIEDLVAAARREASEGRAA